MVKLDILREKEIVKKIAKFLYSPYYIIVVAAIVFLCHTFGLDIVGFYAITLLLILGLIVSKNTITVIPCILLFAFNISVQNAPTNLSGVQKYYLSPLIFPQLIIIVFLLLSSLIAKLIVDGDFKRFLSNKKLLFGFLAFGVALVMNGFFSLEYSGMNLLFGLGFAIAYIFIYLFFATTVEWDKKAFNYFALGMIAVGLVVSLQLCVLYLRSEALEDSFNKGFIKLGWGVSNTIGTVLLMVLPFALYMLHTRKISFPYFLMASAIMLAIFYTQSRGTLIFALPIFISGLVFSSIFGKSRKLTIIFSLALAVVAIIFFIVFNEKIMEMLRFYIESGLDDRGRFSLWFKGLTDWLKAPVFGIGFMHKWGMELQAFTFYHNTLVQCLVSGGIVCLLAYLFHRFQTILLFIKKMTIKRFFIMVALLAFLANSLLDCGTFNFYCILFYSIILVFAEKDYNHAISEKADDSIDMLNHAGKIADSNAINNEETGERKEEKTQNK